MGGFESSLEVKQVRHDGYLDSGSKAKEESGMARNLAGAEARSKGQGELERRQLGPHHTQPLPRGSHLPPAKLIIETHLSSQKTMENPLRSKERVCYKADWLGPFSKI